jgi:hypothetical protein
LPYPQPFLTNKHDTISYTTHPDHSTLNLLMLPRDLPPPIVLSCCPFPTFPPAPVEPPKPSPHSPQVLNSISSSPLIADTGCTGLLLQFSNFPALSLFFNPKPLPLVPFTLPDRSVLLVGGSAHLTGELAFPHKASPVSAYFLPDSDLSHSLLGISPLIRPHGLAIFTHSYLRQNL